jgi:hypothetical protein
MGRIVDAGCVLPNIPIELACEVIFGGPFDPAADACAIGFGEICP